MASAAESTSAAVRRSFRAESLNDSEQDRLERVFEMIGNFCYEKAREIVEKDKEGQKIDFWQSFYKMVTTLIDLEKGYTNFAFLATKTIFTKKESTLSAIFKKTLKNGYSTLRVDMQKAGDANLKSKNKQEALLCHLLLQMSDFAMARLELMKFYEQLLLLEMKLAASYEDLLEIIEEISGNHGRSFHHPVLNGLQAAFTFECDVILNLLHAQRLVSNLFFMEPLYRIHEATERLQAWSAAVSESSQGLFARHSGPPALHCFLKNFKNFLLSKYTLYFYKVLCKHASPSEMRSVVAKESHDLVSECNSFQRRTDADHVLLVFNASAQEAAYLGHGYFLPEQVGEPPSGINSYPVIFATPTEPGDIDQKIIVMRISGRLDMGQPCEWEQLVYAYDRGHDRTYFIRKMEARVFLALVFAGQKPEKDKIVLPFLNKFANVLRGFNILRSMRPS